MGKDPNQTGKEIGVDIRTERFEKRNPKAKITIGPQEEANVAGGRMIAYLTEKKEER